MADGKLLNIILKTIDEVQKKNKASVKEKTADPSIFDMIKDKLGNLDNIQQKQNEQGKKPSNIIDLIKSQIEAAKTANQKDPDTETADSAVFDRIIKKVEKKPKKAASKGIKRLIYKKE